MTNNMNDSSVPWFCIASQGPVSQKNLQLGPEISVDCKILQNFMIFFEILGIRTSSYILYKKIKIVFNST
jgi:hypothetical protein